MILLTEYFKLAAINLQRALGPDELDAVVELTRRKPLIGVPHGISQNPIAAIENSPGGIRRIPRILEHQLTPISSYQLDVVPHNSRRARIILLSRGGVRNAEIGRLVDYSDAWVRQIIHRFNQGGVPAIAWYPNYCAHGTARKFVAEVVEQVVEVALSSPKALIGMNCWSLPKLRDYLIEQKIVGSITYRFCNQPGDYDHDGDVDHDDFNLFESCASGPAVLLIPGCEGKDFDGDNDVDQNDFAIFQRCYSGQNNPVDPGCMN